MVRYKGDSFNVFQVTISEANQECGMVDVPLSIKYIDNNAAVYNDFDYSQITHYAHKIIQLIKEHV